MMILGRPACRLGRPRIPRRVCFNPQVIYFKPRGIPLRFLEEVILSSDEIEAIRLKDVLGLDQIDCAKKMKISQSTFARVLGGARRKISQGLIEGKAIRIEK